MSENNNMNPDYQDIRFQAQTGDGVNIGIIRLVPSNISKEELDKILDEGVERLTRQRAKVEIINQEAQLHQDEEMLKQLIKQESEQKAQIAFAEKNRGSGKAPESLVANHGNTVTNIGGVRRRIDERKHGLENMKALVG